MAWGIRKLELRVQDRTDGHLGALPGTGRATRFRRRGGFTVIEVVISIGVLSVMMSLAGLAMMRSANAYQDTTQRTALELRVRRALDRVIDELAGASATSITPPLGENFASNTITFQPVVDIAGGVAVLGAPILIRTEMAPGEALNGADTNGNGLVDEQVLVLIRNPGTAQQVRAVIARGVPQLLEGETANGLDDNGNGLVDEPGFSLTRVGNALLVRLTCQQPDGQGGVQTRTVETSISLRN